MEHEIDLTTADRDVLIDIIMRQQAIIERLEKRVAQLEGRGKSGGSGRMPGLKPRGERKPDQPKKPRKPRRHGFARARMTPTQRVEQALEQCPDCGTGLAGGWVQRTREVIELPRVPVQVTEHVYIARVCPQCQRGCTPTAQLEGAVLDQQRLGINAAAGLRNRRAGARLHHPSQGQRRRRQHLRRDHRASAPPRLLRMRRLLEPRETRHPRAHRRHELRRGDQVPQRQRRQRLAHHRHHPHAELEAQPARSSQRLVREWAAGEKAAPPLAHKHKKGHT